MTWTPGELPQLDSPESQGLSGERLALIDAYLQGYIDQEKLAVVLCDYEKRSPCLLQSLWRS